MKLPLCERCWFDARSDMPVRDVRDVVMIETCFKCQKPTIANIEVWTHYIPGDYVRKDGSHTDRYGPVWDPRKPYGPYG